MSASGRRESGAPVQRTRLAPSPTGALHLGNARTFLVTWALARQRGWRIVLRIEDLDGPRNKSGASESAIRTLEWLGIDWDEGPTYQSRDLSPYVSAMDALARAGMAYPSDHTRSDLEAASAPQEGAHETAYPASLRPPTLPGVFDAPDRSWRFATPKGVVTFQDALAGPQAHDPSSTIGDFVIWTKRGQPAYQLAVVVDDHRQGVTDVVRGNDLLDSAARQLRIYRALGMSPEPGYWHLPLVRGQDGRRLAKRHGDTRVDRYRQEGVGAERVLGLMARWCGLGETGPMSPKEFASGLNVRTIPTSDVVFTVEDDAWLLAGR